MALGSSPTTGSWMADEEISFRKTAHEIITHLPLYASSIEKYSFQGYFSTGGFSQSLVALVNIDGKQRIVKTTRWSQNIKREVKFLESWESQGIPIPRTHLLLEVETTDFGLIAIAVMEYIAKDSASKLLENAPSEEHISSWRNIGGFLAQIHQTSARGFGKPMPPDFVTGKYSAFAEFVTNSLISEEARTLLIQNKYDLSSLNHAIATIDGCKMSSCLAHHDLGLHNVLGINDEMIVFDPDPTIDCTYIDVATSYIFAITQSSKECAEEMLSQYRLGFVGVENNKFEEELFKQALFIRLLSKHGRWLRNTSADRDKKSLQLTQSLLTELVNS